MAELMPTVFLGHGNPMNAISENECTRGWASIGGSIPRPSAVLVASAHWYAPVRSVAASPAPQTIHDFGGFPEELYEVQYGAPGSPELARRIRDLLAHASFRLDEARGLDHGAWSVLVHIFPNADVPVVQLSIDRTQPPSYHYELGRSLSPLREEGVLILGSGNVVHNLAAYAWGSSSIQPFGWAARFERTVRDALLQGDDAALIEYEKFGPDALMSAPTPDHYLPLLYVLGARREGEPISFPVQGTDGGSISMLAVRFG